MAEKFITKKSLGQHFLNNSRIPEKMAQSADISAGDTVVEIGPGTGALTERLLAHGARVTALETDARAVAYLTERFRDAIAQNTLTLYTGDVRELSLSELNLKPHTYKVVANIPYYLSGRLFRMFLDTDTQPTTLVFLVQKEIAERIACDQKESLLSLSVKVFGDPTYIATVAAGNFTPPPKVTSAIIAVRDISNKQLVGIDRSFFFEVLHLGFAAKRKQLLGNLSKRFDRSVLMHTFATCGIPETVRGEDVPIETWLTLVRALSTHR